jgi:hypothetical protein
MRKRGGFKVIAFDKSPFKLFTLKFLTKSLKALSCKRPKTIQRTLFLSFEINNCFPLTVLCRRLIKKSGKVACHLVNSNIAFGSLPTLQMSHELIALFEKIYYGEPIFTELLKYRGGCTISLFQLSVLCEKCVAARQYSVIGQQL